MKIFPSVCFGYSGTFPKTMPVISSTPASRISFTALDVESIAQISSAILFHQIFIINCASIIAHS